MARRRYGSGYGYGYGGGRVNYRRRERRSGERQVELVTFGLIILLFLISLLYPLRSEVIAFIGGGILTASALYQWQRRWRVNPMTWIGGIVLLILGVLGLQGRMAYSILLPLAAFGLVLLASFLTGEF
jgi:hypothetical protein